MKVGDRVKVTGCHAHSDGCKYHHRQGMVLSFAEGENVKVQFPDDTAWFYIDELAVIEEGSTSHD